jgi:hypothetical protein
MSIVNSFHSKYTESDHLSGIKKGPLARSF